MPEKSDRQKTRRIGIELLENLLRARGAQLMELDRSHFEVVSAKNRTIAQIKCSNGYGWQMSLDRFVTMHENDGWQKAVPISLQRPDVVHVFVWLGERHEKPNRVFFLTSSELQEVVRKGHQDWLDIHGGVRPEKPESVHHDVRIPRIEEYEDRWDSLGLACAPPTP